MTPLSQQDFNQKTFVEEKICLRCHNQDPSLFFFSQGEWCCLKCLDFGRLPLGQKPNKPFLSHKNFHLQPILEFELLPFQKEVSSQVLSILKEEKDVLLYAAAGCGKTEMTLESICWYLGQGKKVCFAISRRQVVMEIAQRLSKNFPTLQVIPVCQGYTKKIDGDLIVCTTHQLYRYPFCFDLLILDELDAFPYAGNEVLEAIAMQSCIGQKLLLSATPDEKNLQAVKEGHMEMVNLFRRPHQKPLCVPRVVIASKWRMVIKIMKEIRAYKSQGKQVLLFVPRILDTKWMRLCLRPFFKTEVIHSKSLNKDEIMARFHAKQVEVLICTTLLERGITVPSVQVIVYQADHPVFTTASLIQIFGRVGRSFSDPFGQATAYIEKPSLALKACIQQLNFMNAVSGVEHKKVDANN